MPETLDVPSVHRHSAALLDGGTASLAAWSGRVLLVVNVASRCGFTPQYAGLEQLWRTYGPARFAVLGFPCNQFGAQEPGDSGQIRGFCTLNYGVSFPMFARVEVNGPGAHPLFRALTQACPGLLGTRAIKWNFTKFLVDASGVPVRRFAPSVDPRRIAPHIESLLAPPP